MAWWRHMKRGADGFRRVYRAGNSPEAYLLKGMLEQYGVRVRIVGDGLSSGLGELPADVIQVDIEVDVAHEALARALIDEYERGGVDTVTPVEWNCPRCGEKNPPAFDVCWNCRSDSGRETGS